MLARPVVVFDVNETLREGNAPLEVGPQPNYVGDSLDEIADQLIERYPR